MKLLLDTHAALWLVNEYEKLSPKVKALILDHDNDLYLSIASVWEIAIKVSIGKLKELPGGVSSLLSQIEKMPIELIPITSAHIEIIESLPFIHRDPFDRILIATAKNENMTILTDDNDVSAYGIPCIW